MEKKEKIEIIEVTSDNVGDVGVFCIKNKKSPGYGAKVNWFKAKINEGVKILIAIDQQGRQLGFIEYLPSELAWRPVRAKNYLFIQCIAVFAKVQRDKGLASLFLKRCEKDAVEEGKYGICTMTSEGAWIANKMLFERNHFRVIEKLDRFELLVKPLNDQSKLPCFNDWTKEQLKYKGWNLVYSNQCPWHEKSVKDLLNCAMAHGIELNIIELKTPYAAQQAPSGFGTFSLIKDGKLLGDHYISKTRFQNILKQQMK